MKIIRAGSELPPGQVCLAIGVFDGVHLGHQQVIRQTVALAQRHEARSVVITFDCHPNTIVAPARVPPLIYSLPQKLRAIAALQPHATLLIHFDSKFSSQSGEEFVRGLHADFGTIRSICVGRDFTFGHKRTGDVSLLERLGTSLGFTVHGLSAVSLEGAVISSTRIRQAIQAGQLDDASQMLGRTYVLAGTVVQGDHLGQKIGFPTANVDCVGRALPPSGVYAAHAQCEDKLWRAVVNIGFRPTLQVEDPQLRVEAHLLDCQENLYGREMELSFAKLIRAEQKFPSLAELKRQIARDIAEARRVFTA